MFDGGSVDGEGGTASSREGGCATMGRRGVGELDLDNAKGPGDMGRYESM